MLWHALLLLLSPLAALISRVYGRTSLIVTTNLPFGNWVEVAGSERLTRALLDPLTNRLHILEANGPSYRLRETRQQLQRPRGTTPAPP